MAAGWIFSSSNLGMQSDQVPLGYEPLGAFFTAKAKSSIWASSLLIPAYCAVLSVVLLVLAAITASGPVKRIRARLFPSKAVNGVTDAPVDTDTQSVEAGFAQELKAHVGRNGGVTIYSFMVVRLLAALTLTGLFIITLILDEEGDIHTQSKKKHHKHRYPNKKSPFSRPEWMQFALALTSAYASLLALVSVAARKSFSRRVIPHLNTVLLAIFLVYVWRNLWPYATFTQRPKDRKEGGLLVAKLVASAVGAVVVPLFMPRQYVPIDAKEPMAVPNPEQTCSWASLLFYTFLDPIVFLAYRIPHLSYDHLPPLADYDYAKNLIKRSYPHLDTFSGAKKRHMFWGFMAVFRKEYIVLVFLQIFKVVSGFASPLGINGLLKYLENGGEGAIVRPWVWVMWLFLGPMIGSISMQYYVFINTGTLVRVEGIVTQLIFDHALRVRMKAETADSANSAAVPASTTTSGATTPDTASVSGSSSETDEEGTLHASTATAGSTRAGSENGKDAGGKKKKDDDGKTHADGSSKADNLVGKINNLVTTDLNNLVDGRDFLFLVLYAPLEFILCMYYLYYFLGWSSFVGFLVMLVLFPIPGYLAKKIQDVQVVRMKKTDSRVQTVTETMSVLRMIKLFGWERKIQAQVEEKREEELRLVWKRKILDLINNNLNYILPLAHMISTFLTYTLIMKKPLSASLVFSTMSVFDVLRGQLFMLLGGTPMFIQAKVSLDRVHAFLRETELLDQFTEKAPEVEAITATADSDPSAIGFRDATFAWSSDINGALTPSRRNFKLRVEPELWFQHGGINLIIGPTGSGKTSLLMALLGEMHFEPHSPASMFHLPRDGGVAYAAQESWVQNETIKDNILFGAAYDEERYKKVIYQCGLKRDLTLFTAGDLTEVGEKGLTLSGGQKARITLARAVYSSAETLLLDDVLAALDVHTAKWIVDKCFKGDLIRGRTVLLVTHNVAMTSSISDFVVSLGTDGRIRSQGTVSEALAKDSVLMKELKEEKAALEKAEHTIEGEEHAEEATDAVKTADGKLIVAEEIAEGHVGWPAMKMYFTALGGKWPVPFWGLMLSAFFACELSNVIQTWFLGYWAHQYDLADDPTSVNVGFYLSVYTGLLVFATVMYAAFFTMFVFGQLRASRVLHNQLLESVLGTTLRWLDTTPTSRIIARCTQDIRAVDGPISEGLGTLIDMTLSMLMKLGAVVLFTPFFFLPGVLMAVIGGYCGQVYIKAQLSVKREMSVARAPVLGHFGAAMAGLVSIRAYGAQAAFKAESLNRINRYTRSARTFYNLNRWVCVRVDALGGLFAAGLAAYLVYGRTLSTAANTGFSLTMAVGFSGMILWWIRVLNEFEVSGNSLERIQEYVTVEQEPKPAEGGVPPAYWPASGDIRVEKLSARYSADGPKVLHDISFHIKSGERVGVVGRTGSGKSSLTLSLLRCIFTEGEVYYDGLPTASLNLDSLRSNITIIPQVPELLSGTLRQNLDPFSQHDDATLNDSLRAAGLYSVQSETDEGKLGLESPISSGGGNLSVGQRQILALARAIVRQSKLLILDEATSAIDYETDNVIQSSLRRELKSDVTVITIAHRLQTIMDADKIMVLDAGRLVEFDSPQALLKNDKGLLKALVDESGDKEALYSMAERGSEGGR